MGSLTIRPVRTRRELKRFVKVPFRLHRGSEQWVPPLIFERMQFLDRRKNPWFEHGEAEFFLAERDGEAVLSSPPRKSGPAARGASGSSGRWTSPPTTRSGS